MLRLGDTSFDSDLLFWRSSSDSPLPAISFDFDSDLPCAAISFDLDALRLGDALFNSDVVYTMSYPDTSTTFTYVPATTGEFFDSDSSL